jgi:hypothetical protein
METTTMNDRTVMNAFQGEFERYRRLCEDAMTQVSDLDFCTQLNPTQNSISEIVERMYGDMVSRWTTISLANPDKLIRGCDCGYIERGRDRDALMSRWNQGWDRVFEMLETLSDSDLDRIVMIGGVPHTIATIVARQISHCAWHAGRIALIARHLAGDDWKFISVAPTGLRELCH